MQMKQCDVVVVGSGFGGACAAYALTRAGYDTILVERGRWVARDAQDWDARHILVDVRYAGPSPIAVTQYERKLGLQSINEVVGGGSIFYGGAALRLRDNDLVSWPITYQDLERYYCRAEQLLEIHGEAGKDPFEPKRSEDYPYPPAPLTRTAERIYRAGRRLDFHPFAMPMAVNYGNHARTLCESCTTCDGFPCKIKAKNDVVVTALEKCTSSNLQILTGHLALRLEEKNGRVVSVECLDPVNQKRISINAKIFLMACGALESPALLLRSGLDRMDTSGAIGRYLMRHCNAIVGCWFPFKVNPDGTNHKQLCLTDFYEDMREELGSSVGVVQDMLMPPPEGSRHKAPRGLGHLAAFFNRYIQCLLCIAEDMPQEQNQVLLDSNMNSLGIPRLRVQHQYCAQDIRKRNYLVKHAKKILREAGGWISVVQKIDTFSHALGTLRFGKSPETAVLDKNCRFFALENLYVVDASFMPSSGGVNPSLTIAANALRVADRIIGRVG